ncbi:hypothetical protein GJ744_005888 [Endocarpon pusillum]|uniref:Mediator of RNA polymerase II transcription subunit 1 n=1 Tax=Endocarpon pusillum TaxID=364733 RepID=A0A8H7AKG2_9EURO|nr:hypothetical protein GJ744_005888 [Endocarpon pusillum]
MATPSAARPHSSSTPKNQSIATPTPMLPSPRPPTSAAMARNISQKSPAMKTPASGHGHSHTVSTSSHPSSTPLAAPALGEDPLNFNSPVAMMLSSLSAHGLTPLPSGADGLGISTDLNTVSAAHDSVLGTRNPEEEKSRRLQEVITLLRTSVAGRGIYREGVESLAQLAGFTHMWQGDTLAIAGTCVDLEITFDGVEKDKAKDVVLKIFTPESVEHKKDASKVLMSNLQQLPRSSHKEPWHSLKCFATNLEHLGRMDQLSQGISCFEAIEGLYLTFRKIWEGEKKRMGQRKTFNHLSHGHVGRPVLNRRRKLGLGLDYWAERRVLRDSGFSHAGADAMELDQPQTENDLDDDVAGIWTAVIDCEVGYPSLRVSKEWVMDNIWDDAKDEHGPTHESLPKIAWVEPSPTLVRPGNGANDSNIVELDEADIKMPKPPQVRFVLGLESPVLMPLSVTSTVLGRQGLLVTLDDSKYTTYDQALRSLVSKNSQSNDDVLDPPTQRWSKAGCTYDIKGKAVLRYHSYTVYSAPQIWCYPVQSVIFDHPKHLADLLPTLRQYVLLWTLLRSIVSAVPNANTDSVGRAGNLPATDKTLRMKGQSHSGITKKSNLDPRRAKVRMLLRERLNESVTIGTSGMHPLQDGASTVPLLIDVSLTLTSSTPPSPRLDLIWPLQTSPDAASSASEGNFGSVAIEIGSNGEIVVPFTTGIPWAKTEKGLKGIAQALQLCEDLGLVVEWIMEKLRD